MKALQSFLKAQGTDIYPEGLATGLFGPLTRKAIERFQLKYGIVQKAGDLGYGNFGPKTRAKINEILGQQPASVQNPASPPASPSAIPQTAIPVAGSYTRGIALEAEGSEVSALQNFLKSQGSDIYPEVLVTGYFGGLTQKAVQRFQIKYGIVSAVGDPGYGYVGPKTRAKINELLGL